MKPGEGAVGVKGSERAQCDLAKRQQLSGPGLKAAPDKEHSESTHPWGLEAAEWRPTGEISLRRR